MAIDGLTMRTVAYTFTATDSTGQTAERTVDVEVSSGLVETTRGHDIWLTYGVCGHPNNALPDVYGNSEAWVDSVADMNASTFRGLIAGNLPHVRAAVNRARTRGVKIQATVCPEDMTITEDVLLSRLEWIRDNALPEVEWVDGVNEPFEGPDRLWTEARARKLIRFTFAIWHFCRTNPQMADVKVISPSFHMTFGGTPAAYRDIVTVARTVLAEMAVPDHPDHAKWVAAGSPAEWWHLWHYAGMHYYTGARPFGHLWTERYGLVRDNWNDPRVIITETGFHNAVNCGPNVHNPISEAGSATLSMRTFLELLDVPKVKGIRRYEILDNANAAKDEHEKNFGTVRVGSNSDPTTWSHKPEYVTMRDHLALLRDPDPTFRAYPVELAVDAPAGVRWRVTTTSNRPPTLWLWRPGVSVWNIATRSDIAVEPVPVTIATETGTQTVPVGGAAVGVPLA